MEKIEKDNDFTGIGGTTLYSTRAGMYKRKNLFGGYNVYNTERPIREKKKNYNIDVIKNVLCDKQKTLDINIEFLIKVIKSSKLLVDKDKELSEKMFINLKEKQGQKLKIIEKINQVKLKHLIDKQINIEKRRKQEEISDLFKEKIKEKEDNVYHKEEFIKMFQKKLNEVDTYIDKFNRNPSKAGGWIKYKGFVIADFVEKNDALIGKLKAVRKEKEEQEARNREIRNENRELRNEEMSMTKEMQTDRENSDNKIWECAKRYKRQINGLKHKIKQINDYFDKLSSSYQILLNSKLLTESLKDIKDRKDITDKTHKVIKIEEKKPKIIVPFKKIDPKKMTNCRGSLRKVVDFYEEQGQDKCNKMDLSKRINNFMDFSIVLNKRGQDETKFEDMSRMVDNRKIIENVSNINMWDISAIGNKDNV